MNGKCSAVDSCVTRVIDLGSEQACTDHASCLPNGNGFMCKCDNGYEMVDDVCVDIDETQNVLNGCSSFTIGNNQTCLKYVKNDYMLNAKSICGNLGAKFPCREAAMRTMITRMLFVNLLPTHMYRVSTGQTKSLKEWSDQAEKFRIGFFVPDNPKKTFFRIL